MPEQQDLDTPGLLHHIMIRGIGRRKIFNDDKDRGLRGTQYIPQTIGYCRTGVWEYSHMQENGSVYLAREDQGKI